MRAYGAKFFDFSTPPDTVSTLVLTTASQSLDYEAGAHVCRLTCMTSAGVENGCYVNMLSTVVVAPTSGTTSSTASAVAAPVLGSRSFNVSTNISTGWSAIANTAGGYLHAEFWRK